MPGLLFVSQAMLDSWSEQGRLDVRGVAMVLLDGPGKGRSYALEPAVRFVKLVGAEQDPHRLVGRVKTVARLRERGAEILGDSVLLGETGYEVQHGFLADAQAVPGGAQPPPPTADAAVEKKRAEAEALARFLLENLS